MEAKDDCLTVLQLILQSYFGLPHMIALQIDT